MIKGTKVDGVYDKDPKKYPDAVRFDTLSVQKALEI
jgi:uridylate kinase